LGYSDGEGTPPSEMFAAVGRITRAVSVPVTVDAEGGYGLPAAELAGRLSDAGAVGCNIEDTNHAGRGLVETAKQADKLAELREAAGTDLVINARTDLFLYAEDPKAVLEEAIERAHAYLAAGADCVYPILIRTADVFATFIDAVSPAAVNAIYLPGGPSLSALGELGLARISLGTGLWRMATSSLRQTLGELATGTEPY
jgi:2-methylisocitrate lyase-like PEP mutase family enzyme